MLKAVILVGGPQKGTRFRPLSLEMPKPLFPVAGRPLIEHHIQACLAVPHIREIIILGSYATSELRQFVTEMCQQYRINIRYLQEYTYLGTAGGIYHFRDQIMAGEPSEFIVINGDVCGDFCLSEVLTSHRTHGSAALITVVATEATRAQSTNYGCLIMEPRTNSALHYVEKPETFVSTVINTGVYVCSSRLFDYIGTVFKQRQSALFSDCGGDMASSGEDAESISLEQHVLTPMAGGGRLFVHRTGRWWSQIKTAAAALHSSRHYLRLYRTRGHPALARDGSPCTVIGDVWLHPSASVHPTAVLGPNVCVGQHAVIEHGVRLRDAIVLGAAQVRPHALVMHAVIGWNSQVGQWARVEGACCHPDANEPHTRLDNRPLFSEEGRLHPSVTVLGCNVTVPAERMVFNCVILPHKELTRSYKNEILL